MFRLQLQNTDLFPLTDTSKSAFDIFPTTEKMGKSENVEETV